MKLNKSKKLALIIVLGITALILAYFLKIRAVDHTSINRSNRTLLSNNSRGFDNPVFNSPTNRGRPLGQREFYYPAPASLKN